MKNSEFLPLDGQGRAGEDSEDVVDPDDADELLLSDRERETIDRPLDVYEGAKDPGRLALIVINEGSLAPLELPGQGRLGTG